MKLPLDQIAYAFVGLLIVFGLVVTILSKANLLNLGKPKCPYPCPEHGTLSTKVEGVESDVGELKTNNERLWVKLDAVANDTSFIRGYLIKNGREKS